MSERKAILAGGCFWCLEAVFQRIDGVTRVRPGYIGGTVPDPDYRMVCTGTTGHAEAVEVTYDPGVVSYRELLDVFWRAHDPTTLNRQGNDVGTQYRSAIFTVDEGQRQEAVESMRAAGEQFLEPIVTAIEPAGEFFPAEIEHEDYYNRNQGAGYCRFVIEPKLRKLGLDTAG